MKRTTKLQYIHGDYCLEVGRTPSWDAVKEILMSLRRYLVTSTTTPQKEYIVYVRLPKI